MLGCVDRPHARRETIRSRIDHPNFPTVWPPLIDHINMLCSRLTPHLSAIRFVVRFVMHTVCVRTYRSSCNRDAVTTGIMMRAVNGWTVSAHMEVVRSWWIDLRDQPFHRRSIRNAKRCCHHCKVLGVTIVDCFSGRSLFAVPALSFVVVIVVIFLLPSPRRRRIQNHGCSGVPRTASISK